MVEGREDAQTPSCTDYQNPWVAKESVGERRWDEPGEGQRPWVSIVSGYGVDGVSIYDDSNLFWNGALVLEAEARSIPHEAASDDVDPGEDVPLSLEKLGVGVP